MDPGPTISCPTPRTRPRSSWIAEERSVVVRRRERAAIKSGISAQTWAALFTRDGGERDRAGPVGRNPFGRPTSQMRKTRPNVRPRPRCRRGDRRPPGPISRARDAARRTQSINNLKQIALALHCYHDVHKTFPAASYPDEHGRPRLSWRVAILPYVQQIGLYRQFHLDEPWDSQHNKRLIERMPDGLPLAQQPGRGDEDQLLSIRGPRTVFPGRQAGVVCRHPDGTSNT